MPSQSSSSSASKREHRVASEALIDEAIGFLYSNPEASQASMARRFSINRATLRNRLQGKHLPASQAYEKL